MSEDEKYYKVVLLRSRNKDNKESVPGFKERKKVILVDYNENTVGAYKKLLDLLYDFTQEGLPGEMCRLYISINKRSHDKVKKALTVKLINEDNINLSKLESIMCNESKNKFCHRHILADYLKSKSNNVLEIREL